MFSSSPYAPHHHQLPSPSPFLFDSSSPFYSEAPSPASSSMSSPSSSASGSRNRINMACVYCRYRKIKCDGGSPCTTCTRTKRCCQYQEVSDDVNRATKERKAYLKQLRIQSLGKLAPTTPSPRGRRGVSASASASSSAPSTPGPQLSPSTFIDGWTPTPSSPTPSTAFSRPFPSVLMGTPLHAAFSANLPRSESNSPSSPAENQTYSQLRRPSGSQTPPRSRSPSPQPYHSISNYSTPALGSPGYTSYFPHVVDSTASNPQWSPSSSVASSQAPFTPVFSSASSNSSFHPTSYYNHKRLNPSSPPTSPEDGASFVVASSYTSSYPAATTVDLAQEPTFYLPPSPEVKQHSRFASMQQQFLEGEGRNPGLGLDLPAGFAPGLPSGGAGYYEEEMAQEQSWACGGRVAGMVVEEEPEMIVFQGWGTA